MILVSTKKVDFQLHKHLLQPSGGFVVPLYNPALEAFHPTEDFLTYDVVLAYNGLHHFCGTTRVQGFDVPNFCVDVMQRLITCTKHYANVAVQ